MADIRSFKIVGGDEIVAEVIKVVESANRFQLNETAPSGPIAYIIKRPNVLRFQPVAPGQLGLAFVPWTLSNPEIGEVVLPAKSLLTEPFRPAANVEKQYLEQTSGLDLSSRLA